LPSVQPLLGSNLMMQALHHPFLAVLLLGTTSFTWDNCFLLLLLCSADVLNSPMICNHALIPCWNF
ncbi:hypothetical protein, partial [Actinobacillus pleuropneumoniae]|uniref:hypothetical protein n=1 Tax=Actinobacillus pleuropneumoniae TaxID=715 RepID=UPI00227D583D